MLPNTQTRHAGFLIRSVSRNINSTREAAALLGKVNSSIPLVHSFRSTLDSQVCLNALRPGFPKETAVKSNTSEPIYHNTKMQREECFCSVQINIAPTKKQTPLKSPGKPTRRCPALQRPVSYPAPPNVQSPKKSQARHSKSLL